jgi:hypothetical protein
MPVALIAALELIQEGQANPVAIPFDLFDARFDELQQTLGEGATGMGWEPFLHLASTAEVWTLWKGPTRVDYNRATRPKSRAQLIKLVDNAALMSDLRDVGVPSSLIYKLKGLIGETSQRPTSDPAVLAAAVGSLKGRLGSEPPAGNLAPKKSMGSKTSYVRDPKVVRWVLDRAKGTCELCNRPAPFLDSKGEPFLEVHHVVLLSNGGPDTVENARGLCPNCHREVHFGGEAEVLRIRMA